MGWKRGKEGGGCWRGRSNATGTSAVGSRGPGFQPDLFGGLGRRVRVYSTPWFGLFLGGWDGMLKGCPKPQKQTSTRDWERPLVGHSNLPLTSTWQLTNLEHVLNDLRSTNSIVPTSKRHIHGSVTVGFKLAVTEHFQCASLLPTAP